MKQRVEPFAFLEDERHREMLSNQICALIVDDDPNILKTLSQQLSMFGINAIGAPDAATADKLFRSRDYDLILLDLFLGDVSGLDLLKSWNTPDLESRVIVISGSATIPDAVEAVKNGAYDFLVKPIDMQLLEAVIRRAHATQRLRADNKRLRELSGADKVEFVGDSEPIRLLLADARKVALGDSPILLEGETGTGKQVLAKCIHNFSHRSREPFVSVNCAAIAESLFESELFGHERGAFTGAIARKLGKLELIGNGTLFLDEIAELPVNCQAKLLTAIEDRIFERVGGTQQLDFCGRVIAATNRNILDEMKVGSFRKDLFFRLSAYHLRLPPLRDRDGDVRVFIEWALRRNAMKTGKAMAMPDEKTLSVLTSYTWPGNVRELLHHVERVALFASGMASDRSLWLALPMALAGDGAIDVDDLRQSTEEFRKRQILRVVEKCGGNQTEAARLLGIERTHLNRILAQFEGRRSS